MNRNNYLTLHKIASDCNLLLTIFDNEITLHSAKPSQYLKIKEGINSAGLTITRNESFMRNGHILTKLTVN